MEPSDMRTSIQKSANDLIAFAKLERIIAGICILIPFILIWVDGWNVRQSISDYVNIKHAHVFGLLLTMAAMLFIVNGAVYIRTAGIKQNKKEGRWYNIALGVFLFGIIIFDLDNFVVAHYIFAILFFLGSAFVIAFFNDRNHRKISILIASLTATGFIILLAIYLFNIQALSWFTLFWAEWISLAVIGIHYILESLEKIS